MKTLGWALGVTMLIYTLSMTVVVSIVLVLGGPLYNSYEGSFLAPTHAILISLIFTVVFYSMKIMEELKTIKENYNEYPTSKESIYTEDDNKMNIESLPVDECPACHSKITVEVKECPSCGLNLK